MADMGKAGEEIVCTNGHVCGKLLIDVEAGRSIVLPKLRPDNPSPFSIELDKVDLYDHPTRHVCKICGESVTRLRNSTWQISTRQGWVGG